jgi:Putative transposase of IS4/5 family (DUF4096)
MMTPTRRPYDTDLSEAEWALLAPLLPPEKPGGRHRENDLREVINGIRYVLRTGAAWRHVPHDFPTGISAISGSDCRSRKSDLPGMIGWDGHQPSVKGDFSDRPRP